MSHGRCILLFALFWLPAWAGSAAPACDLKAESTAKVTAVIDGQTLRLESGETVRLVGALPPEVPPWWKARRPWPVTARARAALDSLVAGRTVSLAFDERRRDRHNRLLAHLFLIDGPEKRWVQGALVEQGHARVYSFPGNRACVRLLQRREAQARIKSVGLWRINAYAIRAAVDVSALMKRRYSFQIVEGKVVAVARRRNWTFVNFGPDYRRDFTIAVRAGDRKAFKGSDVELGALAGRRLRVRGWIESWNGPLIKVSHPEQIEVLDEQAREPQEAGQEEDPAPKAPGPSN